MNGDAKQPTPHWRSSSSDAPIGPAPVVPASVIDHRTLGDWLVQTCAAFGSKLSTAHQVAGKFLEGLENEKERDDEQR